VAHPFKKHIGPASGAEPHTFHPGPLVHKYIPYIEHIFVKLLVPPQGISGSGFNYLSDKSGTLVGQILKQGNRLRVRLTANQIRHRPQLKRRRDKILAYGLITAFSAMFLSCYFEAFLSEPP
jgi:hypothetical protein